jgi:two-component system cell cycle sensor histidine kinase/response regulator CckA
MANATARTTVVAHGAHLHQSSDLYRDAFAHTLVGLAITTLEGNFLEVNPAFQAITGYGEQELLERSEAAITHADDREPHWQHVSRLLAGELPAFVLEKRYARKGGDVVWVRATVSLARDPEHQPARLIVVAENITEQRRLEQQYRQAQKMEAIGRLAGGVAHDFNNLLTVITGYGEIVLERLSPSDPARALIYEITRAGERAAALTRQLLVFSRRQLVMPRIIDLQSLVADAGNMLRRLIGEDIDLVTTSDPDVWPVKADAGQLEQALLNLAVNARDAMPRGGKLTIETRNLRLDETYTRTRPAVTPGAYVMLAVSDTGCGMTPDVKAHLFEPFFSTKEAGKGTGLGLATVYGIVNEAGGHIEVYSEPNLGSTFKLFFPRCEDGRPSAAKTQPGLAVMPPGDETILLVEDEEAVRVLSRYVLLGCGYRVLEAGHGEEAVRLAEQGGTPIDLLVTDVVMPQLGGRALTDRLRQLHPRLKVLYLSGYTDDAVVRHGVLEREVAFLQKPFSPAALAQKVRRVLDDGPHQL